MEVYLNIDCLNKRKDNWNATVTFPPRVWDSEIGRWFLAVMVNIPALSVWLVESASSPSLLLSEQSVCLQGYLVCLSVCLSVLLQNYSCLSVSLLLPLSVSTSILLSLRLSLWVRPSVCLPSYLQQVADLLFGQFRRSFRDEGLHLLSFRLWTNTSAAERKGVWSWSFLAISSNLDSWGHDLFSKMILGFETIYDSKQFPVSKMILHSVNRDNRDSYIN